MILGIVGTRVLNADARRYAEIIIRSEILFGEWGSVVTGDADGIDTLAKSLCDQLGLPCQVLEPENRQWEPRGFRERNIRLAKQCTRLLCIRDPASATYGSGWTAEYCEKELGKPVTTVEVTMGIVAVEVKAGLL
jgi:hypothetical protein